MSASLKRTSVNVGPVGHGRGLSFGCGVGHVSLQAHRSNVAKHYSYVLSSSQMNVKQSGLAIGPCSVRWNRTDRRRFDEVRRIAQRLTILGTHISKACISSRESAKHKSRFVVFFLFPSMEVSTIRGKTVSEFLD